MIPSRHERLSLVRMIVPVGLLLAVAACGSEPAAPKLPPLPELETVTLQAKP